MKNKILALVLYTYDYYEWEEIKATSFDRKKLKELYKTIKQDYHNAPLIPFTKHQEYKADRIYHCIIKPIKFLP